MKLILGSGSPRRREILAQVGIIPSEIRTPNVDETPLNKELPLEYCRRIAEKKIQALELADEEIAIVLIQQLLWVERFWANLSIERRRIDFLARCQEDDTK